MGRVMDKLHDQINKQDVKVEQLANIVNELVGTVKAQRKELAVHKMSLNKHCQVINTLTAKLMHMDDCMEEVQRKVFPQVRGSGKGVMCP
jgi:hypothetical protein